MRWMHRAQHRGSTTLRRPRKAPIWQLERRMCCPDVRKCVGTLMGAATRFGFVGRTSSRGRLKPGIPPIRETKFELTGERNCYDAINLRQTRFFKC